MANKATSVVDVILGEAAPSSYDDMLAVASVIANRAEQLGVSPEEVVSVNSEFNAYGKALPPGAEKNRPFAESAWRSVMTNGPVNNATFFATPSTTGNLPKGLVQETATNGHVYYSDPKNRAIKTSAGFKTPSAATLASAFASLPASTDVVPEYRPDFTAPITASYAPQQPVASTTYQDDLPPLSYPAGAKNPITGRPTSPIYAAAEMGQKFARGTPDETIQQTVQAFNSAMGTFAGSPPDVIDALASPTSGRGIKDSGYYNPGSEHYSGRALDISTKGMSDAEKQNLVSSLFDAGFRGFGFGSTSIHADMGVGAGSGRSNNAALWGYGEYKNINSQKQWAGIPMASWAEALQGRNRAGQRDGQFATLPDAVIDTVNALGNPGIPTPSYSPRGISAPISAPHAVSSGPPLGYLDSPGATTAPREANQIDINPLDASRGLEKFIVDEGRFAVPSYNNDVFSGLTQMPPETFSRSSFSPLDDPGVAAALAQSGYQSPGSSQRQQSPQASIPSPSQIDSFSGFNSAGDWTGGRVAAPTSSPSYSAPANTPANMGAAGYGITGTPARTTTAAPQRASLVDVPNSGMSLADQYANYGYGRSLAQQAANAALSPKVGDTFSNGAKLAPGTVIDTEELPTGQYRVTAPSQQTAANKALGGMFPGATKPSPLGIMAGLFPGMTSMPALAGSLIGGAIAGPFGAIAGNRLGSMLPAFKSSGGGMPSNPVNVVSNSLPSGTVKSYTDPSTGWRSVTNQYGVTTTDLGNGLRSSDGGPSGK